MYLLTLVILLARICSLELNQIQLLIYSEYSNMSNILIKAI